MANRISPTNDLAFKKVLGSEENKDILQGMIHDFFEIKPELADIAVENPYSIKEYQELYKDVESPVLRETLRDVTATFKVADFVTELQVSADHYFTERTLYYACDKFCSNYNKQGSMVTSKDGKLIRYSSLKPVYALNILAHNYFEDNDALRIVTLYDSKRNKRLKKDYLKIGYFELKKENIESENQRHWRDYFTKGEVSGEAPEYIKKASKIIEFTNLRKEERIMANGLEKAQAIYESVIGSAWLDGKDEGRIEGFETVAVNMLKKGMPIDDISRYTDLPISKIKQLAELQK